MEKKLKTRYEDLLERLKRPMSVHDKNGQDGPPEPSEPVDRDEDRGESGNGSGGGAGNRGPIPGPMSGGKKGGRRVGSTVAPPAFVMDFEDSDDLTVGAWFVFPNRIVLNTSFPGFVSDLQTYLDFVKRDDAYDKVRETLIEFRLLLLAGVVLRILVMDRDNNENEVEQWNEGRFKAKLGADALTNVVQSGADHYEIYHRLYRLKQKDTPDLQVVEDVKG